MQREISKIIGISNDGKLDYYLVEYKDKSIQGNWLREKEIGSVFKQLFFQYQQNVTIKEKDYQRLDPLIKSNKKNELKNLLGIEVQPQNQISIDDIYGELESGDQPKRILKVKKSGVELMFLVCWQTRPDGFVPKQSIVTNTELKKFYPDILLDFYEEMLVFKEDQLILNIYIIMKGTMNLPESNLNHILVSANIIQQDHIDQKISQKHKD